jgi:hypothetical protein
MRTYIQSQLAQQHCYASYKTLAYFELEQMNRGPGSSVHQADVTPTAELRDSRVEYSNLPTFTPRSEHTLFCRRTGGINRGFSTLGANFTLRGQSSPRGSHFAPRVDIKSRPQASSTIKKILDTQLKLKLL